MVSSQGIGLGLDMEGEVQRDLHENRGLVDKLLFQNFYRISPKLTVFLVKDQTRSGDSGSRRRKIRPPASLEPFGESLDDRSRARHQSS